MSIFLFIVIENNGMIIKINRNYITWVIILRLIIFLMNKLSSVHEYLRADNSDKILALAAYYI